MSVSTDQLVRTVKARKGTGILSAVPSVVIVIDGELPVAREEKRNRSRQEQDARKLGEALSLSLPVGTLERLAEFLVDKVRQSAVKCRAARNFAPKS